MRDIGFELSDEARKWKGSAEQQLSPEFRAALKVAADELARIARYALAVYNVYLNGDATFARDVEHLAFLEREYNGRPAPHETGGFPAAS